MAEARIAAGPGVVILAGGGDAAGLVRNIDVALSRGARAVISFGIAGGLAPGLRPGTLVIGRAIFDGMTRRMADTAWIEHLGRALPRGVVADLVGVDAAVCDVAAKAALHAKTGAVAVDMESHVAARLAAEAKLPFAALRVVSDPADRALPAAALAGMRADGSTDIGAVLRSLVRDPRQIPTLVRTALDARAAFLGLKASRRALPSGFGIDGSGTGGRDADQSSTGGRSVV